MDDLLDLGDTSSPVPIGSAPSSHRGNAVQNGELADLESFFDHQAAAPSPAGTMRG